MSYDEMRIEPDGCPCPVWGCRYRTRCDECTKSHMGKGYLNACAFHTMLPVFEDLANSIEDQKISEQVRQKLINFQMKAYSNCRSMQEEMPLNEVMEYLSAPLEAFRSNANESLKKRTGFEVPFNPYGSESEIHEGKERWRRALSENNKLTE